MTKSRLSESARAFIETAESYIAAIDGLEALTEIEFLQALDQVVPLLYGKAQRLRGLGEAGDDAAGEDGKYPAHVVFSVENHKQRYAELHDRIAAKLAQRDTFRMVHDPFGPPDEEDPIPATLSDCLTELYLDMKSVLDTYKRAPKPEGHLVLAQVVPGVGLYWGHNAVEAILAIHWLVHHHYDDLSEEFY